MFSECHPMSSEGQVCGDKQHTSASSPNDVNVKCFTDAVVNI